MRPRVRFDTGADEWRIMIRADTPEELFIEGAAVIARSGGRPVGEPGTWEHITLDAHDGATLFADWLNELLGRSEVERRAYGEVRHLVLRDAHLSADVRGRRVNEWRSPVKAATYHGLAVRRVADRWEAVVLLDV